MLPKAEIEETEAEVYAGARQSCEGAVQRLLAPPAIVRILSEILSEEPWDLGNWRDPWGQVCILTGQ